MTEQRNGRVVVVGSANMDFALGLEHLPSAGETVIGGDLRQRPGGKGANQAVAAARAGATTAFVGAVGRDEFGLRLRESLVGAGVDVSGVRVADGATGVAVVLTDRAGENMIAVAPGVNHGLDVSDVEGLPGLGQGVVVLLQLETRYETVLAVARNAAAAGALVVVNAAPAPTGAAELASLLSLTDILIVNEHEARALGAPEGHDTPPVRLRSLGPAAVVVTLGSAGAVAADAHGAFAVPGIPVDAVDSTGAGDAFCGAFAASIASGAGLREAVAAGCLAGARSAAADGAQGW